MPTEIKLVPKPEGFELRDKRSDKTGQGKDWTPADALYSAFERTSAEKLEPKGQRVSCIVTIWRLVDEKGNTDISYSYAGDADQNGPALIVAGLGSFMGWDRKS